MWPNQKKIFQDRYNRSFPNNKTNYDNPRASIKNKPEEKEYTCPVCSEKYSCFTRAGQFIGKLPLVLNCRHTVCLDCIHKQAHSLKIICHICKQDSPIPTQVDNLQDVFVPNYYLIGLIVWSKWQRHANTTFNNSQLRLIPTGITLKNKKIAEDTSSAAPENTEMCCFVKCSKPATLHCEDCNDFYCVECNSAVHKSARSLWDHKTNFICNLKFSAELDVCSKHGNDVDFLCQTCNVTVCCYCFLEDHERHDRMILSKLNETEELELKEAKEKTKQVLKQLLITQKKLENISSGSGNKVQTEICNYFVDLHANLHFIEKKLLDKADNLKVSEKELENISKTVSSSVKTISDLLAVANLQNKKLNARSLLAKLKSVENTPCYLISNNGSMDAVSFIVDPNVKDIESKFSVTKTDNASYNLITEDDLPLDYPQDSGDMSDVDSVLSAICSTHSNTSSSTTSNRKAESSVQSNRVFNLQPCTSRENNRSKNRTIDYEKVVVTHVDSLECFYVMKKKILTQYNLLGKHIKEYIRQVPPRIENAHLNELYLVATQSEWCRGRVVDTLNKNDTTLYEMFLIDRGRTVTVDNSKLREITPHLAAKRPFVVNCLLYNPTSVAWNKEAHIHFAKCINEKELYMLTKNVDNTIHEVDLMISSSDGSLTSVIDILISTCTNDNESSVHSEEIVPVKSLYSSELKFFENSYKFKKNDRVNVVISYVASPHEVYVQRTASLDTLKKLQHSIKRHYKSTSGSGCIPVKDSYIIVEHKDPIRGSWHRGQVKSVLSNKARVLLVDWGCEVEVYSSQIRILHENFSKVECQAIKVKMIHIAPYNQKKLWTMDAIDFLNNYFRLEETLKMVVHNLDPLEVALFEEYGTMDICLNAKMVENHLADSTGKVSTVKEWPHQTNSNEEEELGLIATMLKNIDNDEDGEDEMDASKGVPQQISLCRLVSPDLIFIKFVSNKTKEDKLFKELQAHYNAEKLRPDSWNVNDSCVIHDLENNYFCRGRIIEKTDDDNYKVYLMDEGIEKTVLNENLYIFHEYFQSYHNMAYRIQLVNIEPAGDTGKWANVAIEVLEEIFKTHQFIYVTKDGSPKDNKCLPVILWYKQIMSATGALEPSYCKYISVNNLFIKLGLARKTFQETNLEPKEGTDTFEEEPVKLISPKIADVETETSKDIDQQPKPADSPYHRKELPMADWKKPFPITKTEFDAWITCISVSGILYIQDFELQSVYKGMETSLKEFFDQNKPTRKETSWAPDQICTIFWEKLWYRGKISKIISPKEVEVIMIDFGSEHIVSPDDLYIEILYPDIPAFASPITLYKVYPKCGQWLDSDQDSMMSIITESAHIVIKSEGTDIPQANVYLENGKLLNKAIVALCENLTDDLSNEGSENEDVIVIEEITESADDPLEKSVDSVEVNTDVMTLQESFSIMQLSENIGEKMVIVNILNVVSYNSVALNFEDVSKESYELFVKMTEEIQENALNQPVLENIKIGDACICPFVDDGVWYRAKVHNIDAIEFGYIFVLFVDFGNVESVATSDLRLMKPEWFKVPVNCHIAEVNIELTNVNHVEYVLQHMKKLCNKSKLIQVVQKDPLLIDIFESKDLYYYQSFLDGGLIKTKV